MCLQGSLDDFSIQDVLQIIALGRKTGWLSVDTPSGGGAIVFGRGRVLAAIDDDGREAGDARALDGATGAVRDERIRERMAASLQRVAGCRRGEFSFQVSAAPPLVIGGRDIAGESLRGGVDVIELLIDVACRQEADELAGAAPADEAREARI